MDGQPALSPILAPLSVIMARVEAVVIADLPYVLVAASLTVLVGTMLLWARALHGAVAPEALAPLRALRAEIAGRKGEDAVARELARPGLPSLRNVILSDGDGWAELDHVVRMRAGTVVLETKNWSGWVSGELEAAEWWQHRPDGSAPQARYNPVLQNRRHVRTVVDFLAGLPVSVRGYVVGAGSARFGPPLSWAVVPLAELATALVPPADTCEDSLSLDEAWRRLADAAALGAPHREAHVAYARGRQLAAMRR